MSAFHRFRFFFGHAAIFFAEDQDVCGDGRASAFERGLREADGGDEIGAIGEGATEFLALLVHGIAGSDRGHHAAGTDFIEHLLEEILVDFEAVTCIFFVCDDDLFAKWHVADGEIERILREARRFESLLRNRGIRICGVCDARGDRIELDTVEVAPHAELRRYRVEEPACPAARFEDVSTMEAEMLEAFVDGLDDFWRRVVGIEDGRAHGIVFFLRELFAERVVLVLPAAVLRVEDIGQPAEAAVGLEQAQLFLLWRTRLTLNLFHQPDGCEVSCKDGTFAARGGDICFVIDGSSDSISCASVQRCSVRHISRRRVRFS